MSVVDLTPWWRTAPNPPCVSWCEDTHPAEEFSRGGGFLCTKPIRSADAFRVEVQAYVGIAAADSTSGQVDREASVWVHCDDNKLTSLSPAAARQFAQDLALAISEAATVAERTSWR